MSKSIFINEGTQKAFEAWLKPFGFQVNPQENERFYLFVKLYYLNEENVSRDAFSKEVKKYSGPTGSYKKGIIQKYYDRLDAIIDFLKFMKIRL